MKKQGWLVALLWATVTSYAQTGPGGVGTNDGTSNLELWVDANSGVTGSSPITVWSDLSGNGVTNTINGNPTLTTNSLNGYSVITFDGTGDYISTNLNINAGTQPDVDIYAVYFSDGATNVGAPWGEDNGGFDRFLLRSNNAGPGCSFAVAHGSGCTGNAALFPANTAIITGVYFDEDVASGSTVVTNGTDLFTFTANHAPETSNNLDIGSIGNGGFDFDGNIAEVLVYNRNLNSAERIVLYNYLSAKYNIALTSNDRYDEDDALAGNYDHEVAGIGRVNVSNIHNDAQGTGVVRILNPTGLDDNEFYLWGHDNGALNTFGETDFPSTEGVQGRVARVWRGSMTGTITDVDVRFDLSSVFGSKTAAHLVLLIDTDNDGLFNDETVAGGGVISGATSIGGDVFEFSNVTGLADNRRFSIGTGNITSTPLPVELMDFNAKVVENEKVDLNWATATEINNDYFDVERSKSGQSWQKVTRVKGVGTSNELNKYATTDEQPMEGVSYYRLRQVDKNGLETYSKMRMVALEKTIEITKVFPNPGDGNVVVQVNTVHTDEGVVEVYDRMGKVVFREVYPIRKGSNPIALDLTFLSEGMYTLKVSLPNKDAYDSDVLILR